MKSREVEFTIPKRMPPLSWEDERVLGSRRVLAPLPVRRIVVERVEPAESLEKVASAELEKKVDREPLRWKIPPRETFVEDVGEGEDKKYGVKKKIESEILAGGT